LVSRSASAAASEECQDTASKVVESLVVLIHDQRRQLATDQAQSPEGYTGYNKRDVGLMAGGCLLGCVFKEMSHASSQVCSPVCSQLHTVVLRSSCAAVLQPYLCSKVVPPNRPGTTDLPAIVVHAVHHLLRQPCRNGSSSYRFRCASCHAILRVAGADFVICLVAGFVKGVALGEGRGYSSKLGLLSLSLLLSVSLVRSLGTV